MSRGQKRQYGYTEYYEQDFVGLRDNNNSNNNNNNNHNIGGRFNGGRCRGGGLRKHQQQQQQPRICYVNADFLNQNTSEFQNTIAVNGIRRRGNAIFFINVEYCPLLCIHYFYYFFKSWMGWNCC